MEHFLNHYAYLALFAVTFLSAMCIPLGAEIAIGYGGALASGQINGISHHFTLVAVILVALAGEVSGSFAGYAIGYFGGRPLVDRYGRFILVSHADLDRAEAFLDGRGEWAVLFVRFIPLLRSFISLVAGLAEMTLVKYTIMTVIGCAVWCTALASLGYSLGATWHDVLKNFSYAGYVLAVLAVAAIAVGVIHRWRKVRAEGNGRPVRAAHARRVTDSRD